MNLVPLALVETVRMPDERILLSVTVRLLPTVLEIVALPSMSTFESPDTSMLGLALPLPVAVKAGFTLVEFRMTRREPAATVMLWPITVPVMITLRTKVTLDALITSAV